jgi:tyrosine-protein kinase Etk/Wzc
MGPIASVQDLISALKRRAGLITLVILIGFPLSVLFALSQPREYEATAVVQIEAPRIAQSVTGAQDMSATNQLDLIQQQLMSRDRIVTLIDEFDLYPGLPTLTEKIGQLRSSIILTRLVDPSQAFNPAAQPNGLSITVRMDVSQQAADVANAMLNSIITEAKARADQRAAGTLEFLVAEEARVVAQIAEIENRIATFRGEHLASLPEGLTAQRERLTDLTEQQIAIDNQFLALQSASDRLRAEEVTRQTDLLNQQRALITSNIENVQAAIAATPTVESQLGAMNRDLNQLETEYEVITTRRTDAAMNQLLESRDQSTRFEVLETALVPEFPISTSRKKLALLCGVLTVGLAFGLALVLELLNPAIRSAAQMERQIGVVPVVVIPHLHASKRRRWPGLSVGALAAVFALAAAIWSAIRFGLIEPAMGLLPRKTVPTLAKVPRRA